MTIDTTTAPTTTLAPTNSLTVERITDVHHWNEHLLSFTVTRPSSFRFRAGEFCMVGLPKNGKPLVRAYSISSPPYAETLEFLSIKLAEGPLTSQFIKLVPGDEIYLGRKPTGTLVTDALLPGRRLFLLATGTGLAPFLSVIRDPDIYARFDDIVLVHSARRVGDLAFLKELDAKLADDPLVNEEAAVQFSYLPTVTREPFRTTGRIDALIANGQIFKTRHMGPGHFDPATDRIMMCGSMAMIKDYAARFDALGFNEGSNAAPGDYVIERAFVG